MPTFYTIEQYLKGKVRNITVPDEALLSILAENDIEEGAAYGGLAQKQRDLALAGLYVWVAMSPTTSQKVSDKDADWEGGICNVCKQSEISTYLRNYTPHTL